MFALLLLVWLVLNAGCTWEIFLTGIFFSALITAFSCVFLNHRLSREWLIVRNAGLGVAFFFALVYEVLLANAAIIRLLLRRSMQYRPAIVQVQVPLKKELARVVLSSCITLTPGTITVDEKEGLYTIHCLDASFAQGVEQGRLVRLLQKMERDTWK